MQTRSRVTTGENGDASARLPRALEAGAGGRHCRCLTSFDDFTQAVRLICLVASLVRLETESACTDLLPAANEQVW
jgi:hypothetical protein